MRGLRRQGPPGSVGPLGSLDRLSPSGRPSPSRPLSLSRNARPMRGSRPVRRKAERGSAALFVAIFAPAMIFMAGLVIDGGAALEAKQRASDIAEQAARAGAGQCDVALLRSQGILSLIHI